MISRFVRTALANRVLTLVAVAALALAGVYSFNKVPIDSYPDVTPSMVQIYTASPGLSPVDVETQVSYPVSIAMYGLPGLERVQSTSIFGLSRVNVYFEDGTDIYFARRLVMERLAKAREQIPEGLGEPQLGPITSGLGRVMMYTLENTQAGQYTPTELRTAQDWIVKPQLRTVPGVTGVLSIGGYEKQYQITLDPNALSARNITVADVRRAIVENNRNVGGSFIDRGGEEYIIRGYGWVSPGEKGLDDLRTIQVTENNGTPVYIRDIADVGFGPAIRRGTMIANGEEAVGGFVLKLFGSNTQALLEKVEAKIDTINQALPDGMQVKPFYSQAGLIEKASATVEDALLEGSVLVLVLLFLFLGNLRSTLIVIASLPLSVLIAFIAMDYVGLSANLMSLGGLAIGIGMMVDGSVVMIENIFRHMEERAEEDISHLRLVGEAAAEIAQPVTFAIAIIVLVFTPLFTLQGTEGKLFSPMAYTICFALVGALVMALTFVPVMASLLFKKGSAHGEPRVVGWLKAGYRPVRDAAIKAPIAVLSLAIVLFMSSLVIFPTLGTEFIPTLREGTFMVRSTLPPGASLKTTQQYAKRVQTVMREFPEVEGVYSRVGRAEVGGDPEPVNVIASVVNLKPLDEWRAGRDYEQLQNAMAQRVGDAIPGLANNFSQPIQLRTDELLSGVLAEVVVSIYGDDLDKLAETGQKIAAIARDVPGAVDVRVQQQGGKPQIVVRPDRQALARYGIALDEVLGVVETGIGGASVGQVFENIRRFDIFLRFDEATRNRIDAIRNLTFRTSEGAMIPLSRVADVEVYRGPKKISRAKASRRLFVQLNVRGRDMGGVVRDIQQRVASDVALPPGYFVEYGGQFENQRRAMARLYVVVPITMALIFLLLFVAFSSLRYAALIYLNVPFAITGGIFALWISGLYLSVAGAVGFIAVFGVAVLNGVVLVSYINQLREQGMSVEDAVRVGAEHRLRPVLMTASVAILGLVPLLLTDGIGANVQRPLAAVVVGGLITSTLLTLLVLPAIYRWFAEPRRGEVV
ncbi:CusA/CzcA family heavy metal efflux RND transporter [uncultured Salinisphaera sp.]|uniref:efflux RND transporter permease subunit n=1 Tax=uncultured Salinisphaera sp. TaxID=359372 RepID=UPI000C3F6F71|nr:CusA/CzcA family heavy metal efflux RND transporter [Xanthomonadales bacterium]|tara:strand:+ start:9361 stop:12465 length:3105 start_codon:yes stop_codon:yes gene_type:complete